jgi:hypothetical protein
MQRRSSSAMATPSTPVDTPRTIQRVDPGGRRSSSAGTPAHTPPSAQRANPNELIPQIACMSQPLSSQRSALAITDVAEEDLEEAVDGLVGTQ